VILLVGWLVAASAGVDGLCDRVGLSSLLGRGVCPRCWD
jgi:hypothetical protein